MTPSEKLKSYCGTHSLVAIHFTTLEEARTLEGWLREFYNDTKGPMHFFQKKGYTLMYMRSYYVSYGLWENRGETVIVPFSELGETSPQYEIF